MGVSNSKNSKQVKEFDSECLLIIGAGPGISASVARKFGKEGYRIGLVSLLKKDADAEQAKLAEAGIQASAFGPCDASDPKQVAKTIAAVRKEMGPISVLHYNPYSLNGGDILADGSAEGVSYCMDVAVNGLIKATQLLLEDLKKAEKGAILITCSGAGQTDTGDELEKVLTSLNITGYLIAKAAQHKTAMQLFHKLKPEGVFVGKVNVNAIVKGTAFDDGTAKIEPDSVADAFWDLYKKREDHLTNVDNPPAE